ncbi:unnamed protein product [Taenia asiatica]|uniref:Transmembrane protein n=1 Tax=Taenia asiatica TaxID=60517 RepID=A0A0R3WCG8_TAEAS|nr:unnamed protein product [Taenia asiatica]
MKKVLCEYGSDATRGGKLPIPQPATTKLPPDNYVEEHTGQLQRRYKARRLLLVHLLVGVFDICYAAASAKTMRVLVLLKPLLVVYFLDVFLGSGFFTLSKCGKNEAAVLNSPLVISKKAVAPS